jgi:hypothetical protein
MKNSWNPLNLSIDKMLTTRLGDPSCDMRRIRYTKGLDAGELLALRLGSPHSDVAFMYLEVHDYENHDGDLYTVERERLADAGVKIDGLSAENWLDLYHGEMKREIKNTNGLDAEEILALRLGEPTAGSDSFIYIESNCEDGKFSVGRQRLVAVGTVIDGIPSSLWVDLYLEHQEIRRRNEELILRTRRALGVPDHSPDVNYPLH